MLLTRILYYVMVSSEVTKVKKASSPKSFSIGLGLLGAIGSGLIYTAVSMSGSYSAIFIAAIGATLIGASLFGADYHGKNKILNELKSVIDEVNVIKLSPSQVKQVDSEIASVATGIVK